MKRLIKKSEHDVGTRDAAILCINGVFIEDETHALCVQHYLRENEIDPDGIVDEDNADYNRPESSDIDNTAKIAMAHKVEFENAIFIEQWSLQNYSFDEITQLFKQNYPNYDIYNDDTHDEDTDSYEKVAKLFNLARNNI